MKYSLMGFGISNREILKYLLEKGEEVFVSERKRLSKSDRNFLIENKVSFEENAHTENVLNCDKLIVSPGVHFDNVLIRKAMDLGIEVDTEISFCQKEFEKIGWHPFIIAVTGSVGKSTTVSMIYHVLNKYKRTLLAGNIGIPVAKLLNDNLRADYLVLEVSSFQLFWAKYFKPDVASILNIYPNHLNWHPNMEHYISSKFKIAKFQSERDYFVYNPNDKYILDNLYRVDAKKIPFEFSFKMEDLPVHLRYEQTVENVAAAKAIVETMGFKFQFEFLEDFEKLPHRMEYITEIDGVKFFNDSKATNAIAVIRAIENFNNNLHLIMAGIGKNEDYTFLSKIIKEKVKTVALVGPIADDLIPYFNGINYFRVNTISEALNKLVELAKPGEVIMLSPGGASFDAFKNFEERGEYFKQLVMQLKEGKSEKR
ncbi:MULTISPECIES: UDP-N-acetylmuramoyl-L-alanine--D-glutamate ligase [unclassified Thermosipho (in: thermotogales)]|uniref:UDP-N-acetylmuramoyl-L-alanine--D-glutamate ligase n=1 Tax=unclassified Thermosipho (in: thermotogales) TaxID=2676525 RepID=UPI000984834C|nr:MULTISPECIES: UDP-N-acetylmuramoyl-L-alanine--D-glutamate ligase [unclassified Thermosipho (in: thermotogales)]MBT1248480.1 UDP-N-acetylmuramoylalanine--D-glutamate ligase [Thermosipho sp. 1244]OOC47251.1 UDP-N-acetylmuramoylalanine--D-glutamate ligase [Thermosipho sp. 1223]